MDNEKGKSLISTGSSNLAKTEKLLATTQKILSELKPQYESERIGNQEWMTRNLDVDRFRNGDLVPHIVSDKEWGRAREDGQPAWCYYDNGLENRKKYGKLYNWYAVNDPRGLAPKGWHVPSANEWANLVEFLEGNDIAGDKMKTVKGWADWKDEDGELHIGNGANASGFNALPVSYRYSNGDFCRWNAIFWSATEYDYFYAWIRNMGNDNGGVGRDDVIGGGIYDKSAGASVRCLRD